MANPGKEATPEPAKAAPGGGQTKLFLVFGLVNLLLVGGLAGFVVLRQGSSGAGEGGAAGAAGGHGGQAGVPVVKPQAELTEFLVNLDDPAGDRYLKCKMVLELSGPEVDEELKSRASQVRDAIITYLSSLRFEDTSGPTGKDEMRLGIRSRVNALLKAGQVEAVYFNDFVVQ